MADPRKNPVRGAGLRARLRSQRRLAAAGAMTGAMYAGVHVRMRVAPTSQRKSIFDRWYRSWAHRTTATLGLRLDVEGDRNREGQGEREPTARLIVANHRCATDIPILLGLFGGQILSRGDLESWPVIGPLAKEVGTLFVDRTSGQSGAAAIRAIRSSLKAQNTVIVFPEGTTYQGDEVRPFFAGTFAAAKGLPVEVIPVGISYPEGTEWWQVPFGTHVQALASRRETPVAVSIGEARELNRRASESAESLQRVVQDLVDRSRARLEDTAHE